MPHAFTQHGEVHTAPNYIGIQRDSGITVPLWNEEPHCPIADDQEVIGWFSGKAMRVYTSVYKESCVVFMALDGTGIAYPVRSHE